MIRKIFTSLAVLSLGLPLTGVAAYAKTIKLDPTASVIKWTGKKVTGQHNGTVKLTSGTVVMAGDTIQSGVIVVDMRTIADDDLKDAATNAKLTGHLKSKDFFGVDDYPWAKLVIKSSKKLAAPGGPTHEVTGDLVIKDMTQPITFPVIVVEKDGKFTASGTATIDRTKYGIRYGSGKFAENLGDKMIYDDFTLQFEVSGK